MNPYLVVTAKEVEANSLTEVVEKYKTPETVAYIDLRIPGGIIQEGFDDLIAESFPREPEEEPTTTGPKKAVTTIRKTS
jgi:hypothetical protein